MSKRIFFSDVHIGLDKCYAWYDRSSNFEKFLDHVQTDNDVAEVVILGDLMDSWICPNNVPPPSFQGIINANENAAIFQALSNLANKKKVVYIPGNHDMRVKISDFNIQGKITNIKFINAGMDSPDDKNAYFAGGDILAIHGHSHDMFNGADFKNLPEVAPLPLGYFISRVFASKKGSMGIPDKDQLVVLEDIIEETIKSFLKPDKISFAKEVFEGVLKYSYLSDNTMFDVPIPGSPNNQIQADIVANKYANLFRQRSHSLEAIHAQFSLADTARDLSFNHNKKIIIMGHTHEFIRPQKYTRECDDAEFIYTNQGNTEFIYANCGSWVKNISGNPWTFIETEEKADGHHVRLRKWNGKTVDDLGSDYEVYIK